VSVSVIGYKEEKDRSGAIYNYPFSIFHYPLIPRFVSWGIQLLGFGMMKRTFFAILSILFLNGSVFAQSPYEMSSRNEYILLGSGLGLSALAYSLDSKVQPLTANDLAALDRNNIIGFDRSASYNYSYLSAAFSDLLLYTVAVSPALLYLSPDVRKDAAQYTMMMAEMMMFTYSVTTIVKGAVQRIRPYAYNSSAPDDLRIEPDSRKSFFSGHASFTFASAMFLSETFSAYNPGSEYKGYVRAGALLLAATTSYLRYASGKHFPTDILTGAVVGSAIGYYVPQLHKKETETQVTYTPFAIQVMVPF